MSAGVVVSSIWFEPKMRTLTTATVSISNAMGTVISNLVGTQIFSEDKDSVDPKDFGRMENYDAVFLIVSVVIFLATLIKFPSKPT